MVRLLPSNATIALPRNVFAIMAKTSAERQAAYRLRHKGAKAKLSVMLSPLAKACLERLARHRFQTQRDCLEDLLIDAERAVTSAMTDHREYFGERVTE